MRTVAVGSPRLFLWPGQALYLGTGVDADWHTHHALQIGFSLGDPFAVRDVRAGPFRPQMSFIAWPGLPHQVQSAQAQAVFVWVEVPAQQLRVSGHDVTRLGRLDPTQVRWARDTAAGLVSEAPVCETAATLVHGLAQRGLGLRPQTRPIDPRIARALDEMRRPAIFARERRIEHLASVAALSPSRFRHLFRQQVGLAVQRHLLWRRLVVAVGEMSAGRSLTESAHAAGFADSAHMTRTFRQMFGVQPSLIFNLSHPVQALSCDPP